MRISIFGCKLLGLVTAGGLAKEGNHVQLVSTDHFAENSKGGIGLTKGEPGLECLLSEQKLAKKLVYVSDWMGAIEHAEVIIISTPSWLEALADDIIVKIGEIADKDIIVINQSTFSVGKAIEFESKIKQLFRQRDVDFSVSVLSMPETITKGSAVNDFFNPDRVILGGENEEALTKVSVLMKPFYKQENALKIMSSKAAEYTKFALNAILATRISLINELSNSAELLDIDFRDVREAIGSDKRIGFHYVNPGCGFGGPSFTADIHSLIETFEKEGIDSRLLVAAIAENEIQKEVLFRKAWRLFDNNLVDKHFAVWGLSFKPNTASVVNAPSLKLVKSLLAQGASVSVFDPLAGQNFMKNFAKSDRVSLVETKYEALENADAMFLMTEWQAFLALDIVELKKRMKQAIIFDGRNIYSPEKMAEDNIKYIGIGQGLVV